MKTAEELSQWVIDNRYPKSEKEKTSDFEMFIYVKDKIKENFISKQSIIGLIDETLRKADILREHKNYVFDLDNAERLRGYKFALTELKQKIK